ncbi:MAG: electron transport complex subunit RsxD [Methylophilaceae bacterium]|nr:electron transport complex subunit RsxD [Methylophilaceae bacterium]MDG2293247.1 electron transport complex subunit RsxD [Methylophilaceae bacterium]
MNRSPYITNAPTVSSIMFKVLLALMPGIAVYAWLFGGGVLITLVLATATALVTEALMLKLRHRPIQPFLSDYSAVITAWLLALAIPPLAPWWLIVVGTAFSIIIAKQLYGGLGYNPFNPAMVGYAVLLISFPVVMTKWPIALSMVETKLNFMDQFHYIFNQTLPANITIDAVTSATPLDYLKTQLKLNQSMEMIQSSPIFGVLGTQGSEYIALVYLAGGLFLWQQRVITWHLPTAFLGGIAVMASFFWAIDASQYANPMFHLFSGASMLGAFFILTDPVSGPTTPKAKLYFAAGAGIITYLIRVYGGYPDGVAFAVIFMNICVPLIDTYTQPRVFGHEK